MNYREEFPEYNESCKLFMDIIKNVNCRNIAEENNFKSTGQALIFLSFQINRICDSVFLRFIGDYAIVILYRSIMEHFLKHFYIFLRFHKEHNDNVGKQYYYDCAYNEQVGKFYAFLWPTHPKVNENEKQNHKQIINNAKQFTFANMLNYMGEIELSDMSGFKKEIIQKTKMEYSISSSYTHGGPEAILMETQITPKNIQHSSASYSILCQLNTINTFTNFDSPQKDRLTEVGQKMDELLKISIEKWSTELKGT